MFLIILRLVLKAIRSTSSRTSFGAKNPKIHKNNKQNKTKGSGMTAGKNRRPCYLREEVFPGESGSQRSHGPWEEARRPRVGRHIRSGRHTAAVQIQRVWTVPWCLRLPPFSTRRSRSALSGQHATRKREDSSERRLTTATSLWNMRDMSTRGARMRPVFVAVSRSQRISKGVATPKGRFPTNLSLPICPEGDCECRDSPAGRRSSSAIASTASLSSFSTSP